MSQDDPGVHVDSIGINSEEKLRRDEEILTGQLILIDEGMSADDVQLLKFVCRDDIGVSKLQSADSALDIFQQLRSQHRISPHDVTYLMECLGLIHRFDLIMKLGLEDIDAIKEHFPAFNQIKPLRKLMLQIAEDLDKRELDKMKVLLSGAVGKKRLQDFKTVLELLVYMEQENLLADQKTEPLIDILKNIKRIDLVNKIQRFTVKSASPMHNTYPSRDPDPSAPVENPQIRMIQNQLNDIRMGQNMMQNVGSHPQHGQQQYQIRSQPILRTPPPEQPMIYSTTGAPMKQILQQTGLQTGHQQGQTTGTVTRNQMTDVQDDGLPLYPMSRKPRDERLSQPPYARPTVNPRLNTAERPFQPPYTRPPVNPRLVTVKSASPFHQTYPGRGPDPLARVGHAQMQMILNAVDMLNAESHPQHRQQQYQVTFQPIPRTNPPEQPMVFKSTGVPFQQILQQTGLQVGQHQGQTTGTVTRNQMTDAVPDDGLPSYPMSRKPRGWCVIINNRDFFVNDSAGKQLPQRSGTDVDAESLQHVFGNLGVFVQRRNNLTDTQMMQYLIDVAHNVDHTYLDCFVCCILTHGVLNHLYGTNGKLISIKDLTTMFQANRCPTLAGKPKMFVLQASKEKNRMSCGELEKHADLQTDSGKGVIPNEADFVLCNASVAGYASHGSMYIHKLCELLEKHSHKEDLLSILVQVNSEVNEANAKLDNVNFYKQIPLPLVTLRKKLYFR